MNVLRHRDFRLLFLGQSASTLGDQVVMVALALFVIRWDGSATALGLVLGAQSVAFVLLLLLGGVIADRLPRQRVMIASDLVRALVHGTLALLIFTGHVRIWQLALLEAAFGGARAFFQPAYAGLLPQTVPEEEIQTARALTQSVRNLAALAGPALATGLVLGAGAGFAFLLDAVTFIVGVALLVGIRPRLRVIAAPTSSAPAARVRGEPAAPEPSTPTATGSCSGAGRVAGLAADLRLGWREVAARAWVLATIAAYAGAAMVVYAFWNVLAPLICRDHYGDIALFGLLAACTGAGALAAAPVALSWKPTRPLRTGLLLGLVWPVPGIELALGAPPALLVATSVIAGFGNTLMLVWWETALARHIPAAALSRVSSYDWMGSLALLPVGQLLAGPLAGSFGARVVLGAGGAAGLGMLALALVPRCTRQLGPRAVPGRAAERPASAPLPVQPSSSRASSA